jgi:apolipoprotein N-acyltransferase
MTGLDATIRALEAAKGIVDKAQTGASGAVIKKGRQQELSL